jgi:type II secretion system protein N
VKLVESLPELTARQRRLLIGVGYPLFGLFVFFVAVYASIPRDRLRERLERELSQDPPARLGTGMDVTISDLSLSLLPPGVDLYDVALKQRALPPPPAGEDKPQRPRTYFIRARSARIDVEAFGGSLFAEGRLSDKELSGKLRASEVGLAQVPGLLQAVPLPLSGKAGLSADLSGTVEPKTGRPVLSSLSGLIELSVEDLVIGDGKAKLVVPGDMFLAQGLTFPRVRLGRVSGRVVVSKGRVTLDQLRTRSPDAEAALEGYVDLRDPVQLSELHLYLRFRPSAALAQKEPTFDLMLKGMAAAMRPDGFLGFSVSGTLATPRSLPAKEPPMGVRTQPLGAASSGHPAPPPAARYVPRQMDRQVELPAPPPPAPPAPVTAPEPPPPAPAAPPPAPAVEPASVPPGGGYRALPGSLESIIRVPPPPPAPVVDERPAAPADSTAVPPSNLPVNQKGE